MRHDVLPRRQVRRHMVCYLLLMYASGWSIGDQTAADSSSKTQVFGCDCACSCMCGHNDTLHELTIILDNMDTGAGCYVSVRGSKLPYRFTLFRYIWCRSFIPMSTRGWLHCAIVDSSATSSLRTAGFSRIRLIFIYMNMMYVYMSRAYRNGIKQRLLTLHLGVCVCVRERVCVRQSPSRSDAFDSFGLRVMYVCICART